MKPEELVNEILDAIDDNKFNDQTIRQFTYAHLAALYEICLQIDGGKGQFEDITRFIFKVSCESLKNRLNMNNKINIAFLVSDIEEWQYDNLYKRLLDSVCFRPSIVVIPRFEEDVESLMDRYHNTLEAINEKYENVYSTVNKEKIELYGWTDIGFLPDILLQLSPDCENFRGDYLLQNLSLGILSVYLPTKLCHISAASVESIFSNMISNISWKIFTEEEYYEKAKEYSLINGTNVVLLRTEKDNDTIEKSLLNQINEAI